MCLAAWLSPPQTQVRDKVGVKLTLLISFQHMTCIERFVFTMKRGEAPKCLSQFHLDDNPNTFPQGNEEEMTHFLTQHLTSESAQSGDTLTHIIHRVAHVGNSIFTIRQGEALPYSTQSRETTTREGGRRWRAVREQSGSVLPADDLRVKGRTQSVLCAHTVRCSCISPSISQNASNDHY